MARYSPLYRAALVLGGLIVGIVLSEAMLHVHNEWLMWAPYRWPPPYSEDGDHVRFALLGGSTSRGAPYSSLDYVDFNLLSPARFILRSRYGYDNVVVDSYAGHGWTAVETVDEYWRHARYKPDVLLIYTGQNEGNHYDGFNFIPQAESGWERAVRRLNTGELLLRSWFRLRRALVSTSWLPTGAERAWASEPAQYEPFQPFELQPSSWHWYDHDVVPSYEREYNQTHFQRLLEMVILHARREGIFPVLIIPEGNHLFPPAVSIYHGPPERKDEALQLFKQAVHAKYLAAEPQRALEILQEIAAFCSFAHLDYELGELFYRRSEWNAARRHLRRAMDTDAQPMVITSEYRRILLELAQRYEVPYIDMHDVTTTQVGREIPDDSSFHDAVHPKLHIYEALSTEITRLLGRHGFMDLPQRDLRIRPDEWGAELGITGEVIHYSLAAQVRWFEVSAQNSFFRIGLLQRALRYLREMRVDAALPADLAPKVAARIELLQGELEKARAHLLAWTQEQ